MSETETKMIGFKADADTRQRLERMADAHDRSLSAELRRILRNALEEFEAQETQKDGDSIWKYRLVPNQPRYKSQGN